MRFTNISADDVVRSGRWSIGHGTLLRRNQGCSEECSSIYDVRLFPGSVLFYIVLVIPAWSS